MNRVDTLNFDGFGCVPHTRGDEPLMELLEVNLVGAFPTPVGMNRRLLCCCSMNRRVPHTRGDEPRLTNSIWLIN